MTKNYEIFWGRTLPLNKIKQKDDTQIINFGRYCRILPDFRCFSYVIGAFCIDF